MINNYYFILILKSKNNKKQKYVGLDQGNEIFRNYCEISLIQK